MDKANKSRIDMKHGFMKSIIRNQVDRDNYDKEVRSHKQTEKHHHRRAGQRHRKPDVAMYIPPSRQENNTASPEPEQEVSNVVENAESDDEGPVRLFVFEFEDKDGKIYKQYVNKGVRADLLAQRMGTDRRLPPNMVKALEDRLQQEINKRTRDNPS